MHTGVSFAIVHHGNQYLITNAYPNREGLADILTGFREILSLHLHYRVPLNLHLSGILIEAIAWHEPDFFDLVRDLIEQHLLEWVGSAYAQNILPLFSREHNLRQLNLAFDLYQRHLGICPDLVKICWLPERVWDPASLASLLESTELRNGGYRSVLLDDRLGFPLQPSDNSLSRSVFDKRHPPNGYLPRTLSSGSMAEGVSIEGKQVPSHIAGTLSLAALPTFRVLRYCVPPVNDQQWEQLEQTLSAAPCYASESLLIYADDLEKAARVGPWGEREWQPHHVRPYEQFLQWLNRRPDVQPALISSWLQTRPPRATRTIESGCYYELAHGMRAGEDYQKWWQSAAWQPYREILVRVEQTLLAEGSSSPLLDLAWTQLMACSYETAWHDCDPSGEARPAPWAKALASHARAAYVMMAAAHWMQHRDGHAHVVLRDVDEDGDPEVVLCNDSLYAVVTPAYGGRLVYLFDLTGEGALMIGNPANDWNWQEELNRCMEQPRNHVGACAEVGFENDSYSVQSTMYHEGVASMHLVNTTAHSRMRGAQKIFRLQGQAPALEVNYALPAGAGPLAIDFCLSPDYHSLLMNGRSNLSPFCTVNARGWRNGKASVCVAKEPNAPMIWTPPPVAECDHGKLVRLATDCMHFQFAIHVGSSLG